MSQVSASFAIICLAWAVCAVPTLIAGLLKWDPVGRLGTSVRGLKMNAQWGWFVFELPALLTFPVIYFAIGNTHLIGNIVLCLWLFHYGHRCLVWCWFIPKRDSTVSMSLCASSVSFNLVNGILLGWFMAYEASYVEGWIQDPRFVIGLGLFLVGALLNIWSDYRLRYLRRRATDGYVLPSGGPFNLACCPNLAGEIVEWIGFALLTWSLPGLAFALWTIANLVPRALWRKSWYRGNFATFPHNRAALIPGIL